MKQLLKNSVNIKSLLILITLAGITEPSYANLPVIDVTNLTQNIVTAMETTAAVTKQIEQYNEQIKQFGLQGNQYGLQNHQFSLQNNQYNNMLTNTLNPGSFTWDPASQTVSNFLNTTDLDYYKNKDGSVKNYISNYQDIKNQNPCFTNNNCTDQQRQNLVENSQVAGSEAEKRANDAELLGIDQQQQTLKEDAANLNSLQQQAGKATGRMQAIQAGNQIASAQANQLLQVRELLIAQQNAEATRAAVAANRKAQQDASHQELIKGSFQPSKVVNW